MLAPDFDPNNQITSEFNPIKVLTYISESKNAGEKLKNKICAMMFGKTSAG